MPKLTFVNLSFNELCQPMRELELTECKWQRLRNLVLNSTKIPWDSTQRILDHLPSLEELHLSLNDYDHVNLYCHCYYKRPTTPMCSCPSEDYKKKHKHLGVKRVHFTGNPVSQWKEICKIGYAFPNLELLIVADCPLKSLELENGEKPTRSESECESGNHGDSPHNSFRNLKAINLNSTLISTWDDIERLSRFPSLTCLRVQGCSLWESHEYTEHERRQFLVARLPNVDMLNGGGRIDADEREDAERAFIRHYMEKPESEQPDRQGLITSNPSHFISFRFLGISSWLAFTENSTR